MLELTETAKDVVREMVASEEAPEGSGLRIAAEPTGDGEASLSLELAPAPAEGDEVVEADGARVFLEPAAASLLDDLVLDARRHEDHVHFSIEPQPGAQQSPNGAA
jgi:Fe-S cluster assembly iron-binding protein IscA